MRKLILVFLGVILLSACGGADSDNGASDNNSDIDSIEIDKSHSPDADPDYEVVFNQNKVHRIDITFTKQNWDAMQADMDEVIAQAESEGLAVGTLPSEAIMNMAAAMCAEKQVRDACGEPGSGFSGECTPYGIRENEILVCTPDGTIPDKLSLISDNRPPAYFDATVSYNNETWEHVAVRYRGNSSLAMPWRDGVRKLPFNLHFDKFEDDYPEIKNQRFWGFKKLALLNNYLDPSLVRDKIVTDLFRDAGVPSPKTSFYEVYVTVKGSDSEETIFHGVYTMTEKVDKSMIDTYFDDNDGNLYKPEGVGAKFEKDTFYDHIDQDFEKKINEDDEERDDVIALFNALHDDVRKTNPAIWRSQLESVFNVDGFLRWLAVSNAIEHWDSYGWYAHNYYLYQNGGKLHWIPWDNNIAMESHKHDRKSLSLSRVGEDFPLIRFLMDDKEYAKTYNLYLEEFYQEFMSEDSENSISKRLQQAYSIIGGAVYNETQNPAYSTIHTPWQSGGVFLDTDTLQNANNAEKEYLLNYADFRAGEVKDYLDKYEQSQYAPTEGWRTDLPENHGINVNKLNEALEFAENGTNAWSLLIIKDGYLVSENYYQDGIRNGGQNLAYDVQSVTKSFISTLVGIAIDRGLLPGVDQPINEMMPDFFSDDPDDWRNSITIEDSLTMTWGYDWPGDYFLADPEHPLWLWEQEADRFDAALNRDQGAEPGAKFVYDSTSSHFLSGLIAKETGMSTRAFADKYLFTPLGIKQITGEPVKWRQDPDGYYEGGFGLQITPRQMAKLGYLMLNKGNWGGKQIVSSDWVTKATSSQVEVGISDGLGKYGYQWWLNKDGSHFHALGYGGQLILVEPKLNLVLVMTSVSEPPAVHDVNKTLTRNDDIWTLSKMVINAVANIDDQDNDGVEDSIDNCPSQANSSQLDSDGDSVGDACDLCPNDSSDQCTGDLDGDGIYDSLDNCPDSKNADQTDSDGDSIGDACDICPEDATDSCKDDADDDGVYDYLDNCPDTQNSNQLDSDKDGAGDVCDICPNDADNSCNDKIDSDSDGVADEDDNCPAIANKSQADSDGDSVGDACDLCPEDPTDSCGSAPELIAAALLNIDSGCTTYIGDNPSAPGQGFEQKIEFCADGKVTKWWNPDPVENPTQPGDLTQEGTWSYSGNTLVIETTSAVMGMTMSYTDKYSVAFTYDNGAKLDLYSASKTSSSGGSTIAGEYELSSETIITMGAFMNLNSVANTAIEVSDNGSDFLWATTKTVSSTCEGFVCTEESNGTSVTDSSGTIEADGSLFTLGESYILQTDSSLVLVRE